MFDQGTYVARYDRPLTLAELRFIEAICHLPTKYYDPKCAEEARKRIAIEEAKMSPDDLLRDRQRRAMIEEACREFSKARS
jgi:hypothetical protein